MRRFRRQTVKQMFAFLHDLYAIRSWDELTTHVLNSLPTLIPTDICSYNDMSSRRRYAAYRGWPDNHPSIPQAAEILGRYAHQHPLLTHVERTKDLTSHKITDFLAQRQFRTTALYNEYYRPLQLPYNMGTAIALTKDSTVAIGFNRVKRDFTDDDLAVLDVLRPHLVQAYGNAERITVLQEQLSTFHRAIDELDHAVLSFTSQARIQWATPRAYQQLTEYWPDPRRRSECLPAPLREWVRHTLSNIDRCGEMSAPLTPLVLIREDRTLTIRLVLDGSKQLLLLDEHRTGLSPAMLKPLGLSPRETEILIWVAQGKTNPEIGAILGISPRTVHKHMGRIYTRLGVENRHAAMALVMETVQRGR